MIVRAVLAAALAAAVPVAVHAAPLVDELRTLQALDTRVHSAGWRLVRGNAAYCRPTAPGIGLLLFDAASFTDPVAVRAALGLQGDIAVQAVAADSPAARAGLGGLGELVSVAGETTAALAQVGAGDHARLTRLHDRVDAALAATGEAGFTGRDGTTVAVAGEPVCATRFELLSKGARAAADGRRVVIGRKLVEDLPDDLLAAALAHELAHNVLGHPAQLNRSGRSWGKVKVTEREADRLMPWLLANAGYDPLAAVRFFHAWGPRHDAGLLRTPDHDGWKTRAARIAAELPALRQAQQRGGGAADWAREFRRGE